MKNENINSCVYSLIQLSGHSPKTVDTNISNISIVFWNNTWESAQYY